MSNKNLFTLIDEKLEKLRQEEEYIVFIEGYIFINANSEQELERFLGSRLEGLTLTPLIIGKRKDFNI